MNTMKKWLAAALALIVALSLIACGAPAQGDPETTGAAQQETSSEATTETTEATTETTTEATEHPTEALEETEPEDVPATEGEGMENEVPVEATIPEDTAPPTTEPV